MFGHRHRRSRVAIVAVSVALLSAGTAGAVAIGVAEDPAPTRAQAVLESDVLHPEGLINDVHEDLQYLRDDPAFGSFVLQPERSAIQLFWVGSMRPELKDPAVASAAQRGITVEINEARFSSIDLERLVDLGTEIIDEHALPVVGIGPAGNAGGLVVTINLLGEGSTPETRRLSRELLSAGIDAPIEFREVEDIDSYASTFNMTNPYKGGGMLKFSNGRGCTAGFSVLRDGGGRILTAGHCAPQGDPSWVKDGNLSETIVADPVEVAIRPALDSLLIDPAPSPATIGRVYHGGYTTSNVIGVGGKAVAQEGEQVCIGGSNSGGTSGGECKRSYVDVVQRFRCGLENNDWCPGFWVESSSGGPITGPVDSGGPVYVLRSEGRAGARGVISKQSGYAQQCPPSRYDYGELCTSGAKVVMIDALLDKWDATLETAANP
ncbi:hypothetical protein NODU109028_02760 [Nocardioides dubius]|uniref:Trypsin n=1 Tax=Nocardioides dubius TaxID=317019 RepID=A0ABP4EBY0_9ACTN